MTQRVGKKALEEAITRVTHLSPRPTVQAQIIEMGANAWAMGVTPAQMAIFGHIVASKNITGKDIQKLGRKRPKMKRRTRAWIAGAGGLASTLFAMFLLGWHIGVRGPSGDVAIGLDGAVQAVAIATLTLLAGGLFIATVWAVMNWINKGADK